VRGFVQRGSLVPDWTRESAGVLVEVNLVRSVDLGEEHDLSRVHREVLYHVIDRGENSRLAPLNHDRTLEVFRAQTGKDGIRLEENRFEIVEQLRRVPTIFLRELPGSISADCLTADTAYAISRGNALTQWRSLIGYSFVSK
jgi:hypothetical protein